MYPEHDRLMGKYDRRMKEECGDVYTHKQYSNVYLYGYAYRFGEDDKAVAQEPCSQNRLASFA